MNNNNEIMKENEKNINSNNEIMKNERKIIMTIMK